MTKRLLLLAGTAEARELAGRLSKCSEIEVLASLAGVTSNPKRLGVQTHSGGFGGVSGLVSFIKANQIELILDATHPFAVRIKNNVQMASLETNIPSVHLIRHPWKATLKDNWKIVKSVHEAVSLLPMNSLPFVAVGRQELKAFRSRSDLKPIVRMIELPTEEENLSGMDVVFSYPLQSWCDEADFFKENRITHLVAKNSGGDSGFAKIQAARELGLQVLMIDRPTQLQGEIVSSVESAERWLDRQLNSRK